jgi:hypothetical protein
MAITLDLSRLPLVLTEFDGELTMAEVEEYIARMDEVRARRRPYVSVAWIRRYTRSAAQMERFGRWFKESEAVARECSLGTALISRSTGFRFALAAIFLIRPLASPYLVCGTWAEAIAYVRGQAGRRGLVLPEVACPWLEVA